VGSSVKELQMGVVYIDFQTKAIRLQNPPTYIHEGGIAHRGNQGKLCACVSLMKTTAPPLNLMQVACKGNWEQHHAWVSLMRTATPSLNL